MFILLYYILHIYVYFFSIAPIDSTDLNMNEYFNQIVRIVIECVTIINENRIKIKYVDGSEVNVGL